MSLKIKKYEEDLDALVDLGNSLHMAMQYECRSDSFREAVEEKLGKKEAKAYLASLPSFNAKYQTWYSEAKVLVKQLLPDRLNDFVRHYEKPKPRKEIDFESYRIEDYLQGLRTTRTSGWEEKVVVEPSAAIPQFRQQLAILESLKPRFTSSLFEIQQLVQADLFDSELEAAKELAKNKYFRAAGAVAGVVIESHLGQVCQDHLIKFRKKHLTISDFNDELKAQNVIDVPTWRFIQHLGDLRNLCDHKKTNDPTEEQINDLISGVDKITKTIF
jgi:hypothetical protein|tara:strand:+ start:376 stop:1194 length:819 start_codon:yes stop_codon:yes gene_type:complete